jgi:hypothetical protein
VLYRRVLKIIVFYRNRIIKQCDGSEFAVKIQKNSNFAAPSNSCMSPLFSTSSCNRQTNETSKIDSAEHKETKRIVGWIDQLLDHLRGSFIHSFMHSLFDSFIRSFRNSFPFTFMQLHYVFCYLHASFRLCTHHLYCYLFVLSFFQSCN